MRASTGLVLALGLLLPARSAARAEGGMPGKAAKGGVFPEATEASDEEAKKVLADLKAAAADKDEKKVADSITPMVTKRHKDFVPELKKLLADRRDRVSAEAARALGSQSDKTIAPLLLKVLTAKTRDKEGFLKDPDTKAAAVESLGRLGEAKAMEEIRELATEMRGGKEINAAYARRIVRACVRYFGLVKDKEAVSYLIDEVEQPAPKDPNSNTNPGADYWKARYNIWAEIRPEVVWALKEITGKEFESLRRWENWFKEEGRKAGSSDPDGRERLKVTFHAGAWGSDHLFQAINAIAGAHMRFVEVYADVATVYEGRADEFLFFLQKAGLGLAGAYGGGVFTDADFRESDVESARETARWIREAGGTTLILQGGAGTGNPASDLKVAAETADAVGRACGQEGVEFCFQPHIGTVVFKEEEIRTFLRLADPGTVGLCLDTGHLTEAGVDLVPFVAAHAKRIRVVHLRDVRRKPVFVGGPFANAGKGTVNIASVLGALRGQDYHGWVVGFADDPREDPAKSAADFAHLVTSRLQLKS